MELITGFVLAGGKSTRMGTDKALLELAGRPLVAHMVDLAGSAANEVYIVGAAKKFSQFAPVIEDVFSEHGPLGGIHAALASSQSDLNLILAVDLPFVETGFLKYLIKQAQSSSSVVVVPVAHGYVQTLCAIYRKAFAAAAAQALAEGRNKVDAVFSKASVRAISEEGITDAGFSTAMFRNVNTPEDWQQARLKFETHKAVRNPNEHVVRSDG